ncbi:FixH family protein [Oryzicola mucosus]|uniref:FixH family protein n=1 Tax=Oryzicola mucosus TaxID=2767425 RepID=A0A8J6U9A3_9HYPH|nr:FixH family protein [Oryzicola mucosus]MBD0416907.1 FixH family protein [Oryzicola mucosus]
MIGHIFRPKTFTGWHMLGVMALFFGTIIGVNVTMATFAGKSWTGLVVQNSYVAGQEFNEKVAEAREQDALGWKGVFSFERGVARYRLLDASGAPIRLEGVSVMFRRPSYEAEDMTLELLRAADGSFAITPQIGDGLWLVDIQAFADSGTSRPFRENHRVEIVKGSVR